MCDVCFLPYSEENFIELVCTHKLCKNCLKTDLTMKIKSNFFGENSLKCFTCNKKINYYQLKEILPNEIFVIYENLEIQNFQSQKKDEKTINCPKCDLLSFIWKDADYFKCNKCNETFCAKEDCKGDWNDHEKISCSTYKKKILLSR